MVGDVNHARLAQMVVASEKVVLRFGHHIRHGDGDVAVPPDVDAASIVHAVVDAARDGEFGSGTFGMVRHPGYVRRKESLILIVNLDRRICPPEKALHKRGTIINLYYCLYHRLAGIQADSHHD